MNELTAPNNIQENDVFIFVKIGEISYAFPALCVLEIIKLVELEYPEKMPAYIAGVLEYQGKIIHIIDLRTIVNIDTKDYVINTHILIIKGKDSIYGIIADKVTDIKRIDTNIIATPPHTVLSHITKGIYINDAKSTTIIDLDSLENWMKTSGVKNETNFSEKASRLLPRDISSKEILHQRRMQLVEKNNKIPNTELINKDVYISFLIGNNTYCLEIGYVGGFYKYSETKMIKVPCTPEFVKGLISIKGDYLTIIDLKKYFDNESSNITEKSSIIAIQSKDFHIGFIVDEISDTMNIRADELFKNKTKGKNLKQENKNEIIEYVRNSKLYLVLNIAEILNNEKIYVG